MAQAASMQLSLVDIVSQQFFVEGMPVQPKAKPFLKWAGGKTQLLDELVSLMPKDKTGRYFEPFLGSGALFFHINPSTAVLNDSNDDLINCYRVIRDNVEDLILDLNNHENNKEYFYSIRGTKEGGLTPVERASRTIFLNRTCFNGLYRVNQKGEFNAPYGYYANPKICNEENLRAVSLVLRNMTIHSGGYEQSLLSARKGDFVYFDPPYLPVSKYSDFKRYTKDSFYEKDHIRLAEVFKDLDSRGCYVMLSNSDHPLVHQLFKSYNVKTVKARRLINKIAANRGKVNELIVRNYE